MAAATDSTNETPKKPCLLWILLFSSGWIFLVLAFRSICFGRLFGFGLEGKTTTTFLQFHAVSFAHPRLAYHRRAPVGLITLREVTNTQNKSKRTVNANTSLFSGD